jgi:hypothetical protein
VWKGEALSVGRGRKREIKIKIKYLFKNYKMALTAYNSVLKCRTSRNLAESQLSQVDPHLKKD